MPCATTAPCRSTCHERRTRWYWSGQGSMLSMSRPRMQLTRVNARTVSFRVYSMRMLCVPELSATKRGERKEPGRRASGALTSSSYRAVKSAPGRHTHPHTVTAQRIPKVALGQRTLCKLTCRSAARRLRRVRCNGWLGVVHTVSTEASCKRDQAPKTVLIRLDARLLDHLRPLRNLRLDDRRELIGRVADSFQTQIGEFGAQVR